MTAPLAATTDPDQLLCRIAGIGDLFAIEGEFVTGKEIPSGHINTTYKATYRKSDGTEDSYILQRINDYVFKDPRAVMRNVEKVTRHINWKVLRRLKDSAGQTLNLYPARGGRNYIDIPGDGIWRCYNYLAGTHTYDVVENTRQAYQAGFAFGSFQDLISDMIRTTSWKPFPDSTTPEPLQPPGGSGGAGSAGTPFHLPSGTGLHQGARAGRGPFAGPPGQRRASHPHHP